MKESKEVLRIKEWLETQQDWIKILDYNIERYRYGLKGFVRFNTERNKTIHTISSIHLDHNKRFNFLFTWE